MLKSLKDAQLLTAVVALESWRRGKLNYMGQTTSFCPPPSQYVGGKCKKGVFQPRLLKRFTILELISMGISWAVGSGWGKCCSLAQSLMLCADLFCGVLCDPCCAVLIETAEVPELLWCLAEDISHQQSQNALTPFKCPSSPPLFCSPLLGAIFSVLLLGKHAQGQQGEWNSLTRKCFIFWSLGQDENRDTE